MPYKSIAELPAHLKKYSEKVRRQYMHVFNSVYKSTEDEARAFKAANSILKKRFRGKENSYDKNEPDYISHLIDIWLGNLNG